MCTTEPERLLAPQVQPHVFPTVIHPKQNTASYTTGIQEIFAECYKFEKTINSIKAITYSFCFQRHLLVNNEHLKQPLIIRMFFLIISHTQEGINTSLHQPYGY